MMLLKQKLQNDPLVRLVLIATLLFFLTSFAYVLLGSLPSGDEPHYLIISQTLLKYHSLDVMRDYINGDYHQFYLIHIDPHVTRNIYGQLLPLHSIGGPLLWLLPYALLGRLGAVLFMSCVSLLIVVNIYKFLLLMGRSEYTAFIVGLAYVVATPLYIYSHLTFIEPIGALVAIYVLRKIFQEKLIVRDVVISSTLLGILPWVHIRFALLEIPLFLILLYKLYRNYKLNTLKYYMFYFLPVILLFLLFEIYSYKMWGTFNPAANQISGGSTIFEVNPARGIFLGLLFDQEYGLLFTYPIFVFLLVGIALTIIRRTFLAYNLCMLVVSVPYIIGFTSFRHWSGGWDPPARFILVLLPLYSLYIAYAIEQARSRFASFWLYLSLAYGSVYNILSLLPPTMGFNGENGYNHTLAPLRLFHYRLTDYLPSLFTCNEGTHTCNTPVMYETVLFVLWIGFFLALVVLMILSSNRKRITL